MEQFDDEYPITVQLELPESQARRMVTIPLYQLDTLPWIGSPDICICSGTTRGNSEQQLSRSGITPKCAYPLDPWSRLCRDSGLRKAAPGIRSKPTKVLQAHLVEETYEVLEAIDNADWEHVKEELVMAAAGGFPC